MLDLAQIERWRLMFNRLPAAELAKYKSAFDRVRTEELARTFARYALTKGGYNHVFLLSKKGHEAAGIVDLVAVKKHMDDKGKLDATEIILFQVRGNGKVTAGEKERLLGAAHKVQVNAGIIEYQPGCLPSIEMLPEAGGSKRASVPEGAVAVGPFGSPIGAAEARLMNMDVVSGELIPGGPMLAPAKPVDTKRSEAAKRAWDTIRHNRASKLRNGQH